MFLLLYTYLEELLLFDCNILELQFVKLLQQQQSL